MSVTASVQARAARSRSVKKGVSLHASSVYSRCSGLSFRARVDRMHIQAIRAAIDLRGPHLNQMNQLGLQSAFRNVLLQVKHGFECTLGVSSVVNPRLHVSFSLRGK